MGWSTFGNVQSTLELQPRLRHVKPALIVRNDRSGADEPNPRLPLLDQYLSAGKLFAKRNLPIRANHLDANFVFYGVHSCRALSHGVFFWDVHSYCTMALLHESACDVNLRARAPLLR